MPVGLLFDIVDRMQLPAAGVFPWARAEESWIRLRVFGAVSRKPVAGREITEMLRVPRRLPRRQSQDWQEQVLWIKRE